MDLKGNISRLRRLKPILEMAGDHPVYLYPKVPFWFVPGMKAHGLLKRVWDGTHGMPETLGQHDLDSLVRSIVPPELPPHRGRRNLALDTLSEFWFHLLDTCNLSCSHCLFSCKPGSDENEPNACLDQEVVYSTVDQAVKLGCRLICFTGGEPFLYPGFVKLLGHLQRHDELQIAVLTNGTLIPKQIEALADLDRSRLHFQVSLDGPETLNDSLRGKGTYQKVATALFSLHERKIPCSTVMAVNNTNFTAMKEFVRASQSMGVETVHFMWHFPLGSGLQHGVPPMSPLIEAFKAAAKEAGKVGITIDNLEAIRAQVFTYPGTRFDLGNAGYTSLCIGPEGTIYPSPASVGQGALTAGHVTDGLEEVWKTSPVLDRLRKSSLLDIPEVAEHPWRLILGGGDLDHSMLHSIDKPEIVLHADPYLPLYREMVLMLIKEEADALCEPKQASLRLRMGDITSECPSSTVVNFTHNNCLLSLGEGGTRGLVRAYYGTRAKEPEENILNPVPLPDEAMDFIPKEGRVRMYGCGSPVADAALSPGEVLVDLGSGSGVECFMAARAVGPKGRVIGVDMTDSMLEIAEKSKAEVERKLGFSNTLFLKGFLEELPMDDQTADVVISNCVVNLCHNKRKVFQEILRILKPGGRLVISDVVCEAEPPLAIRADHQLTGECISGALTQDYLFALLHAMGFVSTRMISRFPYRIVQGHPYFSLTFSAYKPGKEVQKTDLHMYGGPFQSIVLDDGTVLEKGVSMPASFFTGIDEEMLGSLGIYRLNGQTGAIENSDIGVSCCCSLPTETPAPVPPSGETCCGTSPECAPELPTAATDSCCCGAPEEQAAPPEKPEGTCSDQDLLEKALRSGSSGNACCAPKVQEPHVSGCLVCGEPLLYGELPEERACTKCGRIVPADAWCSAGHFVCDLCHKGDPIEVIRQVCLSSKETELFLMLDEIRAHPCFPLHGPEHHALVPGVILSTYKNLGGTVNTLQIMAAIDRGALVPGGSCGFMGSCGAALGVGVAFSALLGNNPLRPIARRLSQKVTAKVLDRISDLEAARCCRKESYIALQTAAELSIELLPLPLQAGAKPLCDQQDKNKECIGAECVYFA